MLWQRSWALVHLLCFKRDLLWLSNGENNSELLQISENILKSPKKGLVTEQLIDFMWPKNSSCLPRCFLDILSSIYYCTVSELSCSSFHCLLLYLSIIWEHCIVTIRLMLIHSLPSFLSYLAWLRFLPCRKMYVGRKEFLLPVTFCTLWLLVLLGRKCLFCYVPHRGLRKEKEVSFPLV